MKVAAEVMEIIRNEMEADTCVVLAYVFGSTARGETTPQSDIDIGVLFSPEADEEPAHGELMDALCRALATDRIDLVPMNRAPVPLRFRIVRDGKLLVCRDDAVRQRFVADTVMRYLDFKPLREQAFRVARDSILRT